MEIILALVIGFGGGWYIAPSQKIECTDKALVKAECLAPQPPTSDSFGATTTALELTVKQYAKCRLACVTPAQNAE